MLVGVGLVGSHCDKEDDEGVEAHGDFTWRRF